MIMDIDKLFKDIYSEIQNPDGSVNYDVVKSRLTNLRQEWLDDIHAKLDLIYRNNIEPLPFSEYIKNKLKGELDIIFEVAQLSLDMPEGIVEFETVIFESLINKLSELIKRLKVRALNEASTKIIHLANPEIIDFAEDLHYKLKRKKEDKKFLGECTQSDEYYVKYAKDLKKQLKIVVSRLQSRKKELERPNPIHIAFDDIFTFETDKIFVQEILIKLGVINKQGEYTLTLRRRAGLLGVVTALRDAKVLVNHSEQLLYKAFTDKLGVEYTRLNSESKVYDDFRNETISLLAERNKVYRTL